MKKFYSPIKKKRNSNSISMFDRKNFLTLDYSYRLLEDIIDLIIVQWNWKHGKKKEKIAREKQRGGKILG